ncbi:hypothetical protein JCM10212_003310 [Sporobolomyces blumeae]
MRPSPRQDARADGDYPRRSSPSVDDLEHLAPVPIVRGSRVRTASQDSNVSNDSNHSLSHLPPLPPTIHTLGRKFSGKTSEPTPLQSSIAYSLSRLLSFETFQSFLSSRGGYQDFSDYLLAFSSPHLHTLELHQDLEALIRVSNQSSAAARAIRDAYCVPASEKKVVLRSDGAGQGGDFMSDMGHALLEIADPPTGLERASQHLLEELYATEFETYVKHRLLAHTKLQLEKHDLNKNDVAGLGEAFVLSNPKLQDCPIVLASPAFCALTGYAQEDIIGRNCRFLQGAATSSESVSEIRTAIREKRAVTQLLLNYDKSGAPFFNLLCILPLFSPTGELLYFIGGQTDVTGSLGSGNRLSLPGRSPVVFEAKTTSEIDLSSFSSTVQTSAAYTGVSDDVNSNDGSANGSARSAYASSPTSSGPYSARMMPDSRSTDSSTFDLSGGKGVPKRPRPFSKGTRPNLLASTKSWTSKVVPEGSTVGALELKQGTVDRRVNDFQTTYEKVIVVSRAGRKILFNTGSFLRYCGLPASTAEHIDNSALIQTDLLDVLKGPQGGESSAEVRAKVSAAFEEGKACSVRKTRSAFGAPTAYGVLHLTPLQDVNEKTTAYVAIFA